MIKPTVFILLITITITLTTAIPGGRTPIKDVKTNQEIQDLGKYSVDEYNKLQKSGSGSGGGLKFSKVIAAESQVVAGTKYYLKIEVVSKNGVSKVFDAEVVVKPWVHSKQLLGFKPAQGK